MSQSWWAATQWERLPSEQRARPTITVPSKLGTFSWKAENGGKECGRHEVDLIRSKTFDVACNPVTDSQHLVPAENGRQLFSVEANERRQHLRRDAKTSGRSTEVP